MMHINTDKRERLIGRWLWSLAALAVAMWLLWMTLRPNATVASDLALLTEPAAARGISSFWLIDVMGNIAVFMPLGGTVALALGHRSTRARLILATMAGALLSATIEGLQMMLPSRVSALDDWLLNTLGAAFGALVINAVLHFRTR